MSQDNNINRVAPNTIIGGDIGETSFLKLLKAFDLVADEKIQVLYSYNNTIEQLNIDTDILVIVTNLRLLKRENGKVHYVFKKDISLIEQQKNGPFYWDKLICHLKDNTTETFGIYHEEACNYFITHLTHLAN